MDGSSVSALLTRVSPDAPCKLEVLWPALTNHLSALISQVIIDTFPLAQMHGVRLTLHVWCCKTVLP